LEDTGILKKIEERNEIEDDDQRLPAGEHFSPEHREEPQLSSARWSRDIQ